MAVPDGYLSLADAAVLLGVQRGRMSALQRSGALEVVTVVEHGRRRVYVSHRSVVRLRHARRHAAAVREWRSRRRLASKEPRRPKRSLGDIDRPLWFLVAESMRVE